MSQAELGGELVPGRRNRDGEEPRCERKRVEASVAMAGDQRREPLMSEVTREPGHVRLHKPRQGLELVLEAKRDKKPCWAWTQRNDMIRFTMTAALRIDGIEISEM